MDSITNKFYLFFADSPYLNGHLKSQKKIYKNAHSINFNYTNRS